MKTDLQLHQDVLSELTWDPRIAEKEIGVAVKDGVVTLTGNVQSYPEVLLAERAAERVAGVMAVANDLAVRIPDGVAHTDTDIAHKAVDALNWDIQVPKDGVKATVTNGWLTLAGTVQWQYQREAAARAVGYITGVRGVTNDIVVKSRVSSLDVSDKIKDALRRRAETEAKRIEVRVKDREVTLTGRVSSFADRRAAENAAWSAPGVDTVKDEIVVTV